MHGYLKMAAMDFFLFLLKNSFLIYVCYDLCHASKLNVPKLLLPRSSQTATNFTLEASDGCFIWRSSRPEVASVRSLGTSDPSACSRTAVVTSVSTAQTRRTTIITAEESVTGQELRCDVIVDEITQMHIETTTKELFLDDSPEEFIIRARNDKNDIFSSLDGMLFDWSLVSDADSADKNAANNVLRLLKFSESSYTALPHIKHLEEQGKRGDRILMKGLQTGGAIVTVKPVDPAYQHLPEHRVRVLVVANLQLSPSVVYILPHLTVTYKVELLKQGKAHEVTMPSKNYRLELENTTVATIDGRTSIVTGVNLGFTELKLKDQTLQTSDTSREPSAGIYVVSPAYLEFTVNPDPSWLLETNRRYVVCVNVFDGENRKIYPSNNLRVSATFPDRHFRVISSTANGTYYVVETLRKGFVNLNAQLKSVTTSYGREFTFEKPVEGMQPVEIFEPIVLLPETVMLPWEPSGKDIKFQFRVSGGSGNYSWHSSNPSAADVQPSGLVSVGSTIGSITVKASDSRNAAHFDTSQLAVVPPSRLAFLPSKVEAEIGSFLNLPIALFGQLDNKEVSFDDCHTIELNILLSDSSIFRKKSVKESSTEQACADLYLEATGVGQIEVTVTYEIGRIKLKAVQIVAAYTPLTPFDPTEVAVVTLGSSLDVVFEGGPRPWFLDASGFFQTASFEKEKLVAAGKPRISDASKHRHLVSVRCLNFGEQLLTFTVGNKPTAKNPFPAASVATVIYACEPPKGLHLYPLIEHPANLPPCPISAEYDDPVPVPLQTDVMMIAVLTDGLGRKFGNFSSLKVDWQVSDSSLGKFSSRVPTGIEPKPPVTAHLGHKWISVSAVGGLLTVTVQIVEYDSRFVDSWFSNTAVSPPIAKSRILRLVGYPKFSPSKVIMFNHVRVETSISIIEGSGHYKVDLNDRAADIAKIDYNKDRNITVSPKSEGSVVLSVSDLCLSPMQSATSKIFVSDIAQIVLQVVDKVELHHEVEVGVKVVDGYGRPIDTSYFSLMDVQPVSRSDIISIRQAVDNPASDRLTAVYIVRGESLGRAILQVSAVSNAGNKIMSPAKEIQVFPPLHLKPKNITIIPGTFFQVVAFGGPQPESSIEFTIRNQNVATITRNGLITALELGSTEIVAMATGLDANNSSRVVFSQDYAVLEVVELTEVRIVTPLKRIQTGSQMPVYAIGLNENVTPFSFANVAPPLKFRWMIANDQVALLRPVYQECGVDMSDEGNFAVRFHALSSGQVTLNLVVTSLHSKLEVMKDSVTIQVFDRLSFISPLISDGIILMMPNTEFIVKTNRDGSAAQLSYVVINSDSVDPPVVTVSQTGLLTSDRYPGQAHLRVTAQEEFGVNHTMVVLIKVKPLSYIMINTDTPIRSRFPGISSFPVGTTINFVVSLHDDVGEEFHATQSTIRFHLNKYDQLQMLYGTTNKSLSARANSPGYTVLKVYEESNPLIRDYIGIPVDSAISPSQTEVTLGSIICFSSHLLTREGHSGEWVSSGDVITIDQTSGIAVANRIGSSHITYNVSYVATQTSLKVVPATNISLKEIGPLRFLTNVVTEKVHSSTTFLVIIENLQVEHIAGLQGSNCSEQIRAQSPGSVDLSFFSCGIELSSSHELINIENIAHVSPTFDTATGTYNCNVTVAVTPALLPVIAFFDTNVRLYAKVAAQEGQAELTSEPLLLPFHPMFVIQNPEFTLTTNQAMVNMKVVATESVLLDLQVISSDESLVRVRAPLSREGGLRLFPVDLQLTSHMWSAAPTVVNLTVTCVLTSQSQVVVVSILRSDQSEMSWGHLLSALLHKYSTFFLILACFTASVSCVVIAYHMVYGQRYHYPGTGSSLVSSAFLSSPSSSKAPSPFTPAYPTPSSASPNRMWTTDRSPYSNGVGHRPSRRTSGLDKSF